MTKACSAILLVVALCAGLVAAPASAEQQDPRGRVPAVQVVEALASARPVGQSLEEWEAEFKAFTEHRKYLRTLAYAQAIADAEAADQYLRTLQYAAAVEAARNPPDPYGATGNVNGYPCGGALPGCDVLWGESKGNPTATNPNSSASGLWQFIDGTWNGYGGYRRALHAPVSVQNEKAAQLWDHGRGCSHWRATSSLC